MRAYRKQGARRGPRFGIDTLRDAVQAFADCNETFLQRFGWAQLLDLRAAWLASEWDFRPDHWTDRQVEEALRGTPPAWDRNEQPVYRSERVSP